MKVLIAATPLTGHVNPLLAVGSLFAGRGDEVVLTTTPAFEPRVEAAGLRFVPLPPDCAAEYRETGLPVGPERYRREFERRFIDPMAAQAELLRGLMSRERPDVVLASSMFLGVLPLLLDHRPRPPIVVRNVSFLFLDRPDDAPVGPGLPPARDDGERARYAALRAQVDAAFTTPVRAYTDAQLARLGLPSLPASLPHSIVVLPDAFVQPTVAGFEYDFAPLPPGVTFVGLLPPTPSRVPRPDWWGDLDGRRRVVLVTQGTLANADFGELIEPALEALADRDDVLVAVTTGGRPAEALRAPLSANARVAAYLPFDELLPRVDVLVTNGGYGSVSQALSAGVPIVAAGRTEDKAEIGARIAWSGAGLNMATGAPTPSALRQAIGEVLGEVRYRQRARALAAEFARHDTAAEVLSLVDAVVDRRRRRRAG